MLINKYFLEIAALLKERIHFNTYGGNPISCASAIATLDVIDKENLQKHCLNLGNLFKSGLEKL